MCRRKEKRMVKFREMLEECQLMDVGYLGLWFMLERRNLLEMNIRERLDKGVVNVEWMNLFLNILIRHLPHSFSDHCPILIQIDQGNNTWGTRHFDLKHGGFWRNLVWRSFKSVGIDIRRYYGEVGNITGRSRRMGEAY